MAVDILVCNLTRFGDLIQTQPLLTDLHDSGYSTGLLCLPNFAGAAKLLRHVDEIWPFPAGKFMRLLDNSWTGALASFMEYAHDLKQDAKPRWLINLTPTVAARMLAHILAGDNSQVAGFTVDNYGYGLNSNVWASFLAVASHKRANSPFNVADLLRNSAKPLLKTCGGGSHELAEPDPEATEWAEGQTRLLQEKFSPAGFVAFQLGASEDGRRWPVEHFARLGERLWHEARLLPILTGSPNETGLSEKYAQLSGKSHPFFSAAGKTDFQQLGALLRKCKLLVSNDTGTMHLAAGLNVPILAIFLATAQAWDTAPLQPGSCCLEPALACHPCAFGTNCQTRACRAAISADQVAAIIQNWLKNGKWRPGDGDGQAYRMWETFRDQTGSNSIRALGKAANEERARWMNLLRVFWSQVLDNMTTPDAKSKIVFSDSDALPAKIDPVVPATLRKAAELFRSIVELGRSIPKNPRAAARLLKQLPLIQQSLDNCPKLSTFSDFWRELCASQTQDLPTALPRMASLGAACDALARHLTAPQAS